MRFSLDVVNMNARKASINVLKADNLTFFWNYLSAGIVENTHILDVRYLADTFCYSNTLNIFRI